MRIIVVGGNGTIGKAVTRELGQRHNIIIAGHSSGDVKVNILDYQSIVEMYKHVKNVDAVVSTVGKVKFNLLEDMTPEGYQVGLQDKLMGQVNLVLAGIQYLSDAGSFTLTSGILSNDPVRYASSASMVNAAIDGFVRGAAIEMPRGIRINAVSPTILKESMQQYADYFHGFIPVTNEIVALAYSKSVEGAQTGQVYPAGY